MVWKYLFNFCYKCNNIFCVDTYCNSQVSNTATFLASIFFIKQENTLLNTLDYCMFGTHTCCTFLCSKHEYLNHWLEHVETVVSILKLVSIIPYHVVSLLQRNINIERQANLWTGMIEITIYQYVPLYLDKINLFRFLKCSP